MRSCDSQKNLEQRDVMADLSETNKGKKNNVRISSLVDNLGFGFSQVIIAIFAGSYFCLEACILSMFALLLPELKTVWDYSRFTESFVCSITFFGMFVGNNIWGYVSDSYGRKPTLIICTFLCIVFGILGGSTIITYPIVFIIIQFFNGIAVGGGGVAFSYVIEFLPRKNRGFWMLIIEIFWTFGSIIGCLLGYIFIKKKILYQHNINFYVFSSILPSFVTIFMVPFVPESILYDILNGNDKKAADTIQWMETCNCGELDKRSQNRVFSSKKNQQPIVTESTTKTKDSREIDSIWDLLQGDRRILFMFISICVFSISGNICYYGVALSSPHFFPEENRFLGTIVLAVSEIPGIIFGAISMHYMSRKASQGVSFLASGICLILLLLPSSEENSNFEMFFGFLGRASVMAASCITWVLAQESLPTSVRSTGVGFAASLGKLGVIAAPFLVQMMPGGNAMIPKMVFSLLALVAAGFCYFYPVETAGRELDFSIRKVSVDQKDF